MAQEFNLVSSPSGRILVLVCATVLLLTAANAARFAFAEYYAAPAMHYIISKKESGLPFTELELERLEAALRRGSELAPSNPDYLAYLANLHQIRITSDRDRLEVEELVRLSDLATSYYGNASALRPTWPYDWGDLALELHRLGNYASAEFSSALLNVANFGPWKDDLQLLIAELGGGTFEYLTTEAQQAYLSNLDRALRRQPQAVMEIVDRHGIRDTACDFASATPNPVPTIDPESSETTVWARSSGLATLRRHCAESSRLPN